MNRRHFVGATLAARHVVGGTAHATQPAQRARVYELHRKFVRPLFDSAGRWVGRSHPPGSRELLWNAMSFLGSPDTRTLGNTLVRQAIAAQRARGTREHFVDFSAAQILIDHPAEMDREVQTELRDFLWSHVKQDGERPILFLGYNANYPAMDTAYAALAGVALDFAPARRRGRSALDRVREYLTRRGLLSEYTSPTYSPISLLAFAEIAEHAGLVEERHLAEAIENRLWLDIATHWHDPTNVLAGPHARAYAVDTVGHLHQAHMVLYHVFGDRLWMTPIRNLFPPADGQVIHHDGDVPFMQVSNVWMASGTYHPRAEIAAILFEKPYPYRVSATSEFGSRRSPVVRIAAGNHRPAARTGEMFEYPAGDLVSTTYLAEDYSVGSATAQYGNGFQTDAFFVTFVRSKPARSLSDISTIFCRYLLNDDGPGAPWIDPERPGHTPSRVLLADAGRVRTIQKDNRVMVSYQAKGQLCGTFHSLRLAIVIPTFYRRIPKVTVGSRVVDGYPQSSTEAAIIWLEDEHLLAAFRPMFLTDHGRKQAISVDEQNGYLVISLYNYDGPPKTFEPAQLHETCNGFVAEIASRNEITPEAFRARVSSARLSDGVAPQGQRVADYRRDGVQLGLAYSMLSGGLKYAVVDGTPQRLPFFEAPGLTQALLNL